MKMNHERYCKCGQKDKKRRSLISYLVGNMNRLTVTNAIGSIEDKKILELGAGTGHYTQLYYRKNHVKCIDINSQLFMLDDVEIIKGDVVKLGELLAPNEKYDYIFSFFMTEYIKEDDIQSIMNSCSNHLTENGRVLITFITEGLLGKFYILGAGLKGIKKFKYSHKKISSIVRSAQLSIVNCCLIKRCIFEMGRLYELKKM